MTAHDNLVVDRPGRRSEIEDEKEKKNVVFTHGHSILYRTSETDVGGLMLKYGGDGHKRVGTCQTTITRVDEVPKRLVAQMNEDG